MAVRNIVQYPESVLRRKARKVEAITPEIHRLIDDMTETMYAAPGVGLAAPQVGISLRVAVIDISHGEEEPALIVLVNPVMLEYGGEVEEEEGCLSICDFNATVRRYDWVRVGALDRDGNPFEMEGEGYLARAFQHELDHLDGILFIDRLSPLKRDLFKRKFKKMLKESAAS